MNVFFEDEVLAEGKQTAFLDLSEGRRVYCRICANGRIGYVEVTEKGFAAEGFEVEDWGDVKVLHAAKDATEWNAAAQESEEIDGVRYVVTAVCERDRTQVWVDGASTRLYVLPSGDSVGVQFAAPLSAVAVAVRRGERTYLLLASLYEGEPLYDGWVDGYALSDKLMVECTFDDMKRHTRRRVFGYKDGKFGLIEQSFSCAYRHTFIPALTPYLFLEAVAVGDHEEAKGYLCGDLAEDYDALLKYVGAVDRVRKPPFACDLADVGVVDEKGVGRVFRFDSDEGVIADVREINP